MRAWRVHSFGEPAETLVLEDVPAPTPSDLSALSMGLAGWEPAGDGRPPFTDWVLLEMSVAALALPDVTTSRGTYPVPVARPYIPGQEGVGVVIDAAPGRQALVGRRVVAVTMQPWGSLAERSVGISTIFEVPGGMTDEEAAGFLIPAHTAYHAAVRRGGVAQGETVAVLGAAGGVGAALVQISLAQGARVIAVVGNAEKVAFCEALGAEAVDHSSTDFVAAARALTGGRGVDVVLDPVQGEMGIAARSLLLPDGRHVLCGHAGGLVPHDPHFYMYNHTLVGATLGSYPRDEMQRIHAETHAALSRMLSEGSYRPTVTRCVPFDAVPAALTDLAARRSVGRIVVRV
ncbi:MAG TPA: zinc-binding dehydrogenase [Acidimicrobiales bacterium]|nr:zinc-binding dehydrogenase [Acidimicrobiales bacterium]